MKDPAETPQKSTAKKRAVRPRKKKTERLRPVSLHPLDFDTAIRGLLSMGAASPKPTTEPKHHKQHRKDQTENPSKDAS